MRGTSKWCCRSAAALYGLYQSVVIQNPDPVSHVVGPVSVAGSRTQPGKWRRALSGVGCPKVHGAGEFAQGAGGVFVGGSAGTAP